MNREINYAFADLVREKQPLVHCITNYVTVNDVANVILACGGSPIMADSPKEVEDITALCSCLLLNMGTSGEQTRQSMLKAGKEARRLNRPIVFDPVGVGASSYRTETALAVLTQVGPSVIRGNVSEIRILLGAFRKYLEESQSPAAKRENAAARTPSGVQEAPAGEPLIRGVDASFSDLVTEQTLVPLMEISKELSRLTKAVIVMTGAVDLVSSQEETWLIRNGCPQMSRITGSGCMLDGIIAAYAGTAWAAGPEPGSPPTLLEAAALATALAGLCGERAAEKTAGAGSGSFRTYFMDEVSLADESFLKGGANIEIT